MKILKSFASVAGGTNNLNIANVCNDSFQTIKSFTSKISMDNCEKRANRFLKQEQALEFVRQYTNESNIFYHSKPFAKNDLMCVRGKVCDFREYSNCVGIYIHHN